MVCMCMRGSDFTNSMQILLQNNALELDVLYDNFALFVRLRADVCGFFYFSKQETHHG